MLTSAQHASFSAILAISSDYLVCGLPTDLWPLLATISLIHPYRLANYLVPLCSRLILVIVLPTSARLDVAILNHQEDVFAIQRKRMGSSR